MNTAKPYKFYNLISKGKPSLNQQFEFGFGKKIVFLHGLGSSGRYWCETSRLLAGHYRTFSFDLLGFGESPKPSELDYFLWQQADALRQGLWDRRIWGRVNIVGHSLGGLVALEFAKRYPKKVSCLVLSNIPVILQRSEHQRVEKNYAMIYELLKNELHRKGLKTVRSSKVIQHKILPRYATTKLAQKVFSDYDLDHISRYAYNQSIKNSIESQQTMQGLDKIKAPVYIVRASKDRAVIKGNVSKLASHVANSKIIDVVGGHQYPIQHAGGFAKIIIDNLH